MNMNLPVFHARMEPPTPHLVFVYGTLKKGYRNHHIIKTAKPIGEAVTMSEYYQMKDTGGFPVVIKTKKKSAPNRAVIVGELYRVSDAMLKDLDGLESNGRMYQRKQVRVMHVGNNTVTTAWIYIGMPTFWEHRRKRGWLRVVEPVTDMINWSPKGYR